MFQRKRKSGVYLHNYTRFTTVTKIIIFMLIISSVIAADSKCKLTSKATNDCDQPRSSDNDSDNGNGSHENVKTKSHNSHGSHYHHHNKLQLNEMKNSIYEYVNDVINMRTNQILANSMSQMLQMQQQLEQEQQQDQQDEHDQRRDFGSDSVHQNVSESNTTSIIMGIGQLIDYLNTSNKSVTGRQLESAEGRLFFFKGN